MNREIKFRAWNDHKKEWYDPELIKVSLDFSMIGLWCKEEHGYIFENTTSWKVIIQQYTGLKDKNGKEIYEGDILRWHKDNNQSEVIFSCGSFSVKGINWAAYWYLGDYNDAYEVIGNIFENPELLEK